MARVQVTSEISGVVWKVEVAPGSRVAEGDILIIVESMKMEIAIPSPAAGTVGEILVQEEQPVSQGQAVAVLDT